jgi:hypothetical protein
MSHHNKAEHGRGQDKQAGAPVADDGARGRSESSPGHLKKAAGAQSARDFAPGRSGSAPGQVGRDRGEKGMETPESDPLVREP